MPLQRWTAQQLLKPQPIDLVAANGRQVNLRLWQPQVTALIKPAIKKQLCQEAGQDRDWLRKVRPWFAHRAHMHVRLRCPADSLECKDQDALPAGVGCPSRGSHGAQ